MLKAQILVMHFVYTRKCTKHLNLVFLWNVILILFYFLCPISLAYHIWDGFDFARNRYLRRKKNLSCRRLLLKFKLLLLPENK